MSDGGGLFLMVQPTGSKWWRWKYRRPDTHKENTLSLGTFPAASLRKARQRRNEARKLLADGIDPGEKRKATREADADAFEAIARSAKRPISNMTLNAALRRLGYDKDTMTAHGFRAIARTLLDEVLHVRPDYIEHQRAHAVRDPNGRAYNRTAHLPERRAMMQQWADYLATLKAGGNVVPMPRKAG